MRKRSSLGWNTIQFISWSWNRYHSIKTRGAPVSPLKKKTCLKFEVEVLIFKANVMKAVALIAVVPHTHTATPRPRDRETHWSTYYYVAAPAVAILALPAGTALVFLLVYTTRRRRRRRQPLQTIEMPARPPPLCILATLLLPATSGSRARVDISLGWRFHLGASADGGGVSCNASNYPSSGLNNRQVFGLSNAPGATDAASCLAAACNQNAPLFQWCPGGGLACGASASCWIGAYPGTSSPGAGWVTGLANASLLGSPIQAQPAFNDTLWTVLDLPHDFEVTGTYTATANGGEGFLPYAVAYYRKRLVLPSQWNGTRVELYVDGALSASNWWLNGVPLNSGATSYSGYTALIMRLDTVPGVVWGGVNVITAFVDGTLKTGWWYEGSGL